MQIQFEGRQATGVVLKHEGQEKVVKSTGEIILAAGTVGTTKLLLLSGVGPKAHLQELKVQHYIGQLQQDASNDPLFSLRSGFSTAN